LRPESEEYLNPFLLIREIRLFREIRVQWIVSVWRMERPTYYAILGGI
jgi:hypothetical protein